MNITSAQYVKHNNGEKNVKANVDGQVLWIPLDPNNRHYAEILKQVKEGKLIIKDADE